MSPDAGPPGGRPAGAVPGSDDLALAVEAVTQAGELQLARRAAGVAVSEKGPADVVTDADLAIEAMFRRLVAERRPGDGVLGEELAEARPDAGVARRWLFDPVDGTANYAHGVPFFCASLALEVHGAIEIAAIYEPLRRELFTAQRGRGAWLNGNRLAVSRTARLAEAMLGTGFPHGAVARVPAMEMLLGELAVRARAVRRFGSAALDLCYVAAGRMDGFWDRGLKPWDTAAGALVVVEAGGRVTAMDGGAFSCYAGDVLASNGIVHPDLLERILLCQRPD
jgi:myo-inositol-1(or 4)-monophosphatase